MDRTDQEFPAQSLSAAEEWAELTVGGGRLNNIT